MRASVRLVGRVRVFVAIVTAALACAGGASAASGWTEVTISASDATPLACAYVIPTGTAPAGGWPGVILFHWLGQSRGGGEDWNAAVAGVAFKAIVPAVAWTDLGTALNPNGVPKDGLVRRLAQSVPSTWDSTLAQAREDLLDGAVTTVVKSTEAARSSRPKLHSLTIPTLLLQGRHDFLFDIDQALAAYKLLAGPKRLYLGDLGHPPAQNPSAEEPVFVTEAVGWFEHYLAGGPNLFGGGVE